MFVRLSVVLPIMITVAMIVMRVVPMVSVMLVMMVMPVIMTVTGSPRLRASERDEGK